MKRIIAFAVLLSCTPALGSSWLLYSIGTDGTLLTIEPSHGAVITSVPITLAGKTIVNGNGLAATPSGDLWGLLTLSGQVGRELVTIDVSGVATSIGNTGRNFAGLAFDGGGLTLYGITGTGTIPPATLYTIDMTTAASESVLALSNLGGHAIAFDPTFGLIYHVTGGTLEKVDVDLSTITPVPTSGYPWFTAQGLVRNEDGGDFLLVANFGLYLSLTTTGVADSLGTTAASKGLAFALGPGAAPLQDGRALELRAWPNPYRGGTLRVSADHTGAAPDLEIFDVTGRLVRVLRHDGTWDWDGQDGQGRAVRSGAYFLRARGQDAAQSARIVVVR